ncbi:High-affinity fructose transporter [Venturia inaequalis]|nr:High-affinity fructose transporter [Venturia inaequalis]
MSGSLSGSSTRSEETAVEHGLTSDRLEQLRSELLTTREISERALEDMTMWSSDNMNLRRENEELKRKDKDIHFCLVDIARLEREVKKLKKKLAQQCLLTDKAHSSMADLMRQREELKRELAERDLHKKLARGLGVKEAHKRLEMDKMDKSHAALTVLRRKEEELEQKLVEQERASVAGSEDLNRNAVPEAPGSQASVSSAASLGLSDFMDSASTVRDNAYEAAIRRQIAELQRKLKE